MNATLDPRSDQELIEAFQQGQREVFHHLVDRHQRKIYNLALRICRDPSMAEDISQEAFVNAFRGLKNFRGESQFGTWLFRIAHNAATTHLKRLPPEDPTDFEESQPRFDGSKHRILDGPDWGGFPAAADAESAALNEELAARIEEALEDMPQKYKSAFLLVQVQGMSGAEAAEALGIGVEALKSRIHRARLYLREKMKRYFAD